ncbi:MAG: ABC-three component system protein [Candidatus Electrothrix sp. GW3-4]|uniref:ABC-three component system protein n=1 Tax=Candidatus Electrothrix sp. GW3-4 TaxID=3126740 RepID=UPI0030D06B91
MATQENITAQGDVAGRDIDKSKTIIYQAPNTQLSGIIEQLKEKIGQDPEAAKFVEKLLDWMTPKDTLIKRDLEQKLKDCDKSYLLYDALEAKERFTKQLKRTTFNPAIQEIYSYILGEIYSHFNYLIKPKIATMKEVGAIEQEIVGLARSITSQIANAPPALGVGITEVIGMLYYLTGNCHLDWDYNAALSSRN